MGFGSMGMQSNQQKDEPRIQMGDQKTNEIKKRLTISNKPHILKKTEASKHHNMMSVKTIKKLARNNTPMFLAAVGSVDVDPQMGRKSRNDKMKTSALCKISAQGMTKRAKRKNMKTEGAKKDFKSVQEKEQEFVQLVEPQYRQSLHELVQEFRDIFPETLPKWHPPPSDVEHEIKIEPSQKPANMPP